MRKPYFKKGRHQAWYVRDDAGKDIPLGKTEEEAYETWRRMLDSQSQLTPSVSFRRLAEEFLQESYEDTPRFKNDARYIARFAKYVGLKKAMSVNKRDVVLWLDEDKLGQKRKDGSSTTKKWTARTKRDAYAALCRVWAFGVGRGVITHNPVSKLKIAPPRPRSALITPEQHEAILAATDPAFRIYLQACACGPRPSQVRRVQKSDVSADGTRWVFSDHKTYHHTGKPLVVYLSPCMQTLTRILMAARPSGPLFRNSQGNPWKKDTVVQKFRRIRDKLKLPKDLINYSYRHTFATNAMLSDLPIETVSELMGHVDTRMVGRVYGHLDQHSKHLVSAAARVKKQ